MLDRIPNIKDRAYATSSTEAPPEPMSDVVYRVGTPNGMTRKYVSVTKIYGDKGLARCRVLKSFDEEGNSIKEHEGQYLKVTFDNLHEPDVFPKFAHSCEVWLSKANMSKSQIKKVCAGLIDGFMKTEALAYDMEEDAEKTVSGIKTLLQGYIGGFFLTFLLSFIKRRIAKVITERSGKPTQKKTFERKMSEMKRLFNRTSGTKPAEKKAEEKK